MTTFRCWVPEEGYTMADAMSVEAMDAESAAEYLAEQWYEGGDHFSEIDVAVAPADSDDAAAAITYRVTVDFDPSFSAVRMKERLIPVGFILSPGPDTRVDEAWLIYSAQNHIKLERIFSKEPLTLLEATAGGYSGPTMISMLADTSMTAWEPSPALVVMPGADLRLRFRLYDDVAHVIMFIREVEVVR